MVWPRHSSIWWKDVVNPGDFGNLDWFNSVVVRKVGNGLLSSFWNDRWRGEKCFRLKYPRLYSVSNQNEALVGEAGEPSDLGSEWRFIWRRFGGDGVVGGGGWSEMEFGGYMSFHGQVGV